MDISIRSYVLKITYNTNSRRVAQFGYQYSYDRSGLKKIDTIPTDLMELIELNKIDFLKDDFEQLIINECLPGQGISAHIDHPRQFGPIIVCITIGSDGIMNFEKGDLEVKLKVKEGSMYIMTGDSRYEWKHSFKNNSSKTRYSLTFRTIK